MMHTAHEYMQPQSESSKEASESFKEDKWLHRKASETIGHSVKACY